MELWEQICRQRIRYIVDCYQLDLTESPEDFTDLLEELWIAYPYSQIELALVETLVASWLQIPPVKGIPFLTEVHRRLQGWENCTQIPTQVTPAQFQQIAGLDPSPVFGSCFQTAQVSQFA